MSIVLDGHHLTIENLSRIARDGEAVELAPEALERIRTCRALVERKIEAHEVMYGINTGIGRRSSQDAYHIRRGALVYNIPYTTTVAGATWPSASCSRTGLGTLRELGRMPFSARRV